MNNGEIISDSPGKVLVVDDDPYILMAVKQTLSMNNYEVDIYDKPVEALSHISAGAYHAVIADVKMPKMHGMELLKRIHEIDPELPVIMITGHGDVPLAVTALKEGAYDFLEKPVDDNVLLASLKRAAEKMRLLNRNRQLTLMLKKTKDGRSSFHNIIGFSSSMQNLYNTVEIVAKEEYPVLITGETGTGKELVARAIHELSLQGTEKFIPINMGAVPENMLESELFGHEAGAFTSAVKRSIGKFEFAGRGTIFLDEISSMPLNLQVKLLRVLEEKKLQRLGSNEYIRVHARIIVASNKDLKIEVEKGLFRADLFFRLNVIPVEIPPLRNRREDIPLLATHFIEEYNKSHEKKIHSLNENMYKWMLKYDWPGNVRELENFIKQLCVLNNKSQLEGINIVEPGLRQKQFDIAQTDQRPCATLKEQLEAAEKEHITNVLRDNSGQINPSSTSLGISRKSLYEKMKKYNIVKDVFKK
jgi:two-component system C4-dicarboxylate transport response regulator DctD